jgi:hypothetical protein
MNRLGKFVGYDIFGLVLGTPILVIYFAFGRTQTIKDDNSYWAAFSVAAVYLLLAATGKPIEFYSGAAKLGVNKKAARVVLLAYVFLSFGLFLPGMLSGISDLPVIVGLFLFVISNLFALHLNYKKND